MFFQSSAAMLLNTNLSTAATTLTKWLVSIPSVSSTKGSSVITQSIYEGLSEFPYFKQHPEHLVLVPHQNDSRASIVALVKTIENIQDTLVLLCDVDTNSPAHYGILKNISTQSDELERQLLKLVEENQSLKQKLEQHDALFGLGVLESKCATGCMLAALKELSDNHVRLNLNILFVCTSGNTQQHQGIKHCIPVMQELCSKENLSLRLTLNAKPQLNNPTFANSAALLNVAANTIAPRNSSSLDKYNSGSTTDNVTTSNPNNVLDSKDAFSTDTAGDSIHSQNTANALASLGNADLEKTTLGNLALDHANSALGSSTLSNANLALGNEILDKASSSSDAADGAANTHTAIQQALTLGVPELCLYTGNYGKIEPSFYILGQSSSVNQPFAGFSASLIAAELIHEFELNPKILQKLHQKPLLPTFDSLKVKDFGKEFSPDGVQLSFNLPMLPAIDLSDVLELMKEVAAKAIENAAEVVDEREALLARLNNQPFVPQIQDAEVISFSDLLERACSNYAGDIRQAVSALIRKCRKEGFNTHQSAITIIERLNDFAQLPRPSIVVYFTDNLVPAQSLNASNYQDRELFMLLDTLMHSFARETKLNAHMSTHYAPSDAGFLRPEGLEKSEVLLEQESPLGFDKLPSLNVPTVTLGVLGGNLSHVTEYVEASMCQYLPQFVLQLVDTLASNPLSQSKAAQPHDDLQLHLEELGQRAEEIAAAALNEIRAVDHQSRQSTGFYSQVTQGTLSPESLSYKDFKRKQRKHKQVVDNVASKTSLPAASAVGNQSGAKFDTDTQLTTETQLDNASQLATKLEPALTSVSDSIEKKVTDTALNADPHNTIANELAHTNAPEGVHDFAAEQVYTNATVTNHETDVANVQTDKAGNEAPDATCDNETATSANANKVGKANTDSQTDNTEHAAKLAQAHNKEPSDSVHPDLAHADNVVLEQSAGKSTTDSIANTDNVAAAADAVDNTQTTDNLEAAGSSEDTLSVAAESQGLNTDNNSSFAVASTEASSTKVEGSAQAQNSDQQSALEQHSTLTKSDSTQQALHSNQAQRASESQVESNLASKNQSVQTLAYENQSTQTLASEAKIDPIQAAEAKINHGLSGELLIQHELHLNPEATSNLNQLLLQNSPEHVELHNIAPSLPQTQGKQAEQLTKTTQSSEQAAASVTTQKHTADESLATNTTQTVSAISAQEKTAASISPDSRTADSITADTLATDSAIQASDAILTPKQDINPSAALDEVQMQPEAIPELTKVAPLPQTTAEHQIIDQAQQKLKSAIGSFKKLFSSNLMHKPNKNIEPQLKINEVTPVDPKTKESDIDQALAAASAIAPAVNGQDQNEQNNVAMGFTATDGEELSPTAANNKLVNVGKLVADTDVVDSELPNLSQHKDEPKTKLSASSILAAAAEKQLVSKISAFGSLFGLGKDKHKHKEHAEKSAPEQTSTLSTESALHKSLSQEDKTQSQEHNSSSQALSTAQISTFELDSESQSTAVSLDEAPLELHIAPATLEEVGADTPTANNLMTASKTAQALSSASLTPENSVSKNASAENLEANVLELTASNDSQSIQQDGAQHLYVNNQQVINQQQAENTVAQSAAHTVKSSAKFNAKLEQAKPTQDATSHTHSLAESNTNKTSQAESENTLDAPLDVPVTVANMANTTIVYTNETDQHQSVSAAHESFTHNLAYDEEESANGNTRVMHNALAHMETPHTVQPAQDTIISGHEMPHEQIKLGQSNTVITHNRQAFVSTRGEELPPLQAEIKETPLSTLISKPMPNQLQTQSSVQAQNQNTLAQEQNKLAQKPNELQNQSHEAQSTDLDSKQNTKIVSQMSQGKPARQKQPASAENNHLSPDSASADLVVSSLVDADTVQSVSSSTDFSTKQSLTQKDKQAATFASEPRADKTSKQHPAQIKPEDDAAQSHETKHSSKASSTTQAHANASTVDQAIDAVKASATNQDTADNSSEENALAENLPDLGTPQEAMRREAALLQIETTEEVTKSLALDTIEQGFSSSYSNTTIEGLSLEKLDPAQAFAQLLGEIENDDSAKNNFRTDSHKKSTTKAANASQSQQGASIRKDTKTQSTELNTQSSAELNGEVNPKLESAQTMMSSPAKSAKQIAAPEVSTSTEQTAPALESQQTAQASSLVKKTARQANRNAALKNMAETNVSDQSSTPMQAHGVMQDTSLQAGVEASSEAAINSMEYVPQQTNYAAPASRKAYVPKDSNFYGDLEQPTTQHVTRSLAPNVTGGSATLRTLKSMPTAQVKPSPAKIRSSQLAAKRGGVAGVPGLAGAAGVLGTGDGRTTISDLNPEPVPTSTRSTRRTGQSIGGLNKGMSNNSYYGPVASAITSTLIESRPAGASSAFNGVENAISTSLRSSGVQAKTSPAPVNTQSAKSSKGGLGPGVTPRRQVLKPDAGGNNRDYANLATAMSAARLRNTKIRTPLKLNEPTKSLSASQSLNERRAALHKAMYGGLDEEIAVVNPVLGQDNKLAGNAGTIISSTKVNRMESAIATESEVKKPTAVKNTKAADKNLARNKPKGSFIAFDKGDFLNYDPRALTASFEESVESAEGSASPKTRRVSKAKNKPE